MSERLSFEGSSTIHDSAPSSPSGLAMHSDTRLGLQYHVPVQGPLSISQVPPLFQVKFTTVLTPPLPPEIYSFVALGNIIVDSGSRAGKKRRMVQDHAGSGMLLLGARYHGPTLSTCQPP